MINQATKESAALVGRGFTVKYIGNAPGKCPECGMRAIVDLYDDDKPTLKLVYLCDEGFYGCGKKFLRDDERISKQEFLVAWEIKHPNDDVGGYLNVSREVLAALAYLNDADLEAWYFQWSNGVIVDSLEKAELEPAPTSSDLPNCVHCLKPLTILDQPGEPPLHDKCRKPFEVFGETTTTKEETTDVDQSRRKRTTQPSRDKKASTGRTASNGHAGKAQVAGSARKAPNPSEPRGSNKNGGKRLAGPSKSDPVHGRAGKSTRAGKPSASR